MKILVIRFKYIGDVLLSSTLCASLRKTFPEAQIDYFMHANAAALFEGNRDIDNVFTLTQEERKTLPYLRKIWNITRAKYDIVIDATSTAKTELISMLSPSSSFKIGRYKKGRGYFYTHRVPKQFNNKIDQRMAMLKPLTEHGYSVVEDRQLKIFPNDRELAVMSAQITEAGINQKQTVIAFSVSSKLDYRYWNLNYMEEVIRHCLTKYHAQVILLPGMAHEQELLTQFHARFDKQEKIVSSIEANSLRDLFALLSYCDLYVGNEGGPRHFAEAVGCPTVCVFSPSANLDEWLPKLSDRHRALEWRSKFEGESEPEFQNGDSTYQRLYDLIRPSDVIPLVDEAMVNLN